MNKISVIIPVYNEFENINTLISHLCDNSSIENIREIIFVDGGSTDGTEKFLLKSLDRASAFGTDRELPHISLLKSDKGRAIQMNFGAKRASGDILYFLHADSFPPQDFDKHIVESIESGNQAGCFRMKFDSNHWWLKLAGWLTALPWKICRGGDQSLFVTKNLFEDIGGYDEQFNIYEDNDLISKMYKRSSFAVIPKWLTTSSRCYNKHGIWKTQFYFWRIHLKKWLGASPQELEKYYQRKILKT